MDYAIKIDNINHIEYIFKHEMFKKHVYNYMSFMKYDFEHLIEIYKEQYLEDRKVIYFKINAPFTVSIWFKNIEKYISSTYILRKDKIKRINAQS